MSRTGYKLSMADDLEPKQEPQRPLSTEARRDTEDGPDALENARARAWFDENLRDLRRTASGERPLYWLLAMAFVVGLVAYACGYLLKVNVTTEPPGLLADLLYTLGWALWTGVVIVIFLQVIPEAKRRQIKRALDSYEAERRTEARELRYQSERDRTPTAGTAEPGQPTGRKLPASRRRFRRR
jgi:hypothetical protein